MHDRTLDTRTWLRCQGNSITLDGFAKWDQPRSTYRMKFDKSKRGYGNGSYLETVAANGTAVDQGLAVLVTLLRFRSIGADREQLPPGPGTTN
jgi:hypothetical protein